MGRLQGKVAFVSGGSAGIGRGIVERFAAEGAAVVFGDLDAAAGESLARSAGAEYIEQDVASEQDWVRAMARVEAVHGRLDVLVNNAGILGAGPLEGIDLARWDRLFAVNVTGVMLGCKHGVLLMQRNPGGASGSIVNMSSNAGLLATALDCGYSATKGAVRLMTKSIGVGFARRGLAIRCNSIHPGPIDTGMMHSRPDRPPEQTARLREGLEAMVPMGRLGRVDEVASMAVFLASDESSFSTGCEFVADGGSTAALRAMPWEGRDTP